MSHPLVLAGAPVTQGPILGRGAFGVVRLGYCTQTPPPGSAGDVAPPAVAVAVKEMPMSTWRGVAREVVAMLRCGEHPNIVRLLGLARVAPDLESPLERAQLVVEYAAGGNLAQLASSWRGVSHRGEQDPSLALPGGLPDRLARRFARDLVAAVAHVHARGVAHCDIKGCNLLLTRDGRALLSDFGSCYMEGDATPAEEAALRAMAPAALGSPGSPAAGAGIAGGDLVLYKAHGPDSPRERGTLRWSAPEIVRGTTGSGGGGLSLGLLQAADVWSIGCTVLELLMGCPPWWWLALDSGEVLIHLLGVDLTAHLPEWLSPPARDFITACLASDPDKRPTAAQLLSHPFLAHAPPVPAAGLPAPRGGACLLRAYVDASAEAATHAGLPGAGGDSEASGVTSGASDALISARAGLHGVSAGSARGGAPPPWDPASLSFASRSCARFAAVSRLMCRQIERRLKMFAAKAGRGKGVGGGAAPAPAGGAEPCCTGCVDGKVPLRAAVALWEQAAAGGTVPDELYTRVAAVLRQAQSAPALPPPGSDRKKTASGRSGGGGKRDWSDEDGDDDDDEDDDDEWDDGSDDDEEEEDDGAAVVGGRRIATCPMPHCADVAAAAAAADAALGAQSPAPASRVPPVNASTLYQQLVFGSTLPVGVDALLRGASGAGWASSVSPSAWAASNELVPVVKLLAQHLKAWAEARKRKAEAEAAAAAGGGKEGDGDTHRFAFVDDDGDGEDEDDDYDGSYYSGALPAASGRSHPFSVASGAGGGALGSGGVPEISLSSRDALGVALALLDALVRRTAAWPPLPSSRPTSPSGSSGAYPAAPATPLQRLASGGSLGSASSAGSAGGGVARLPGLLCAQAWVQAARETLLRRGPTPEDDSDSKDGGEAVSLLPAFADAGALLAATSAAFSRLHVWAFELGAVTEALAALHAAVPLLNARGLDLAAALLHSSGGGLEVPGGAALLHGAAAAEAAACARWAWLHEAWGTVSRVAGMAECETPGGGLGSPLVGGRGGPGPLPSPGSRLPPPGLPVGSPLRSRTASTGGFPVGPAGGVPLPGGAGGAAPAPPALPRLPLAPSKAGTWLLPQPPPSSAPLALLPSAVSPHPLSIERLTPWLAAYFRGLLDLWYAGWEFVPPDASYRPLKAGDLVRVLHRDPESGWWFVAVLGREKQMVPAAGGAGGGGGGPAAGSALGGGGGGGKGVVPDTPAAGASAAWGGWDASTAGDSTGWVPSSYLAPVVVL